MAALGLKALLSTQLAVLAQRFHVQFSRGRYRANFFGADQQKRQKYDQKKFRHHQNNLIVI